MGWLRCAALAVVASVTLVPAVGLRAQEAEPAPATDAETMIRSTVMIVACNRLPADDPDLRPDLDDFKNCTEGSGGSGTIVDANGTVLTNAHVALDTTHRPLWLLVGETVDPRDFPRWAYIGRSTVFDPAVDLAIVEPVYGLDGAELAEGEVQLRPMPIGAGPNDVQLDDQVWMIGYPGVGGAYVKRIPAQVVGYDVDQDNAELNPGWIMVSPAPAPGNSGGTVVDAEGNLVAVPTQGGAGDIRCLDGMSTGKQDGLIDPPTECISMTSDLGRVRPIPEGYDLLMARAGGNQRDEPADPGQEVVVVVGSFVSADTGDPVDGAYFAVLKAGVGWDEYRDRANAGEQAESLLTYGWSDETGRFQLKAPVPTGQEFTVVYGGSGYETGHADGFSIPAGSPSPHQIDPIELAAGR